MVKVRAKGGKRAKKAVKAAVSQKKQGLFESNKRLFLDSFRKINVFFLYQMIVDALFYAAAFFGTKWYTDFFQRRMDSIDPLTKAMVQSGGMISPQAAATMKQLALEYVIYTTLLIILLVAVFAAVKLLIYNLACSKRWSVKRYFRFFGLNSIWMAITLLLLILVQALIDEVYIPFFHLPTLSMARINLQTLVSYIVILAVLHVGYISYVQYVEYSRESKRLLRKTYASSFTLAFTRMHLFSIPYLMALLIWLPVIAITWLLNKAMSGQLYIVSMLILLLLYLTWLRNYLVAIVRALRKPERKA